MNANSKKYIAALAALEILLFHCWVPVFKYGTALSAVERFLISSAYCGVDIFFFISAYSLVKRPVEDYKGFIINRTIKLMPLFIIALALGHFLWFIPSIMIMYLVFPPLYKVCSKRPGISFVLLILGWMLLTYLVLGVIKPKADFGIFLFRIPSIILGAYAVRLEGKLAAKAKVILGLILLVTGLPFVYQYGYINKLNVPYKGTFYLLGLPLMFASILLMDAVFANAKIRPIEAFGSMTLELYFWQMVLGSVLVKLFFGWTGSRIFTNLLTMTVIIIASILLNKCYNIFNIKLSSKTRMT